MPESRTRSPGDGALPRVGAARRGREVGADHRWGGGAVGSPGAAAAPPWRRERHAHARGEQLPGRLAVDLGRSRWPSWSLASARAVDLGGVDGADLGLGRPHAGPGHRRGDAVVGRGW